MAPPTKKLKRGGPSAAELPPDLWAKALDFLYFDEALPLTAVGKSFLRDVPPLVKRLRVRSGESMAVSSAAAARFCGVEDVCVFSFTDKGYVSYDQRILPPELQTSADHTHHLDEATLRNVVPFLSNFPKLEFCYLGSSSSNKSQIESTRADPTRGSAVEYGGPRMYYDIPDHKEKVATLLESACLAYSQGRLSQKFALGSWLPFQLFPGCATSAPLDVLKLDDEQAPCIPFQERVRVAASRDKENGRSILTDMLVHELVHLNAYSIMMPPDFSEEYHQTICSQSRYSKMKVLIAAGANAKDCRIRQTLVEYCLRDKPSANGPPKNTFSAGKRILSLETYRRLEGLGFDISESDFLLVDTSDQRTNYQLYRLRTEKANLDPKNAQLAKERFVSEFNVNMEEVERRVKEKTAGSVFLYDLIQVQVQAELAQWLNISMSALQGQYKEAVSAFMLESRSWE